MLQPIFKKYLAAVIALSMLSVQTAKAQQTTHPVGGFVTDEYGKPLAGARVHSKGDSAGTFTNADGYYHLSATIGQPLLFSAPQFDGQQRRAPGDTLPAIRLTSSFLREPQIDPKTSISNKDTILIPAESDQKIDVLYEKISRESFLGSISTVDMKALEATPASNYLFALQGRLTGLNIAQTSGFQSFSIDSLTTAAILGNIPTYTTGSGPSDNSQFNIQLRGHAASSGQNPIAIVDGVQRELYNIDPTTIQSVSILKDPLSNILLGQNSSRGALIVTTREPQTGPTRLSITAESGIQKSLGLPTPLPAYQYAYLLNESLLNDGKNPLYSQADFNAYRSHSDPLGHPDVNWFHTILRSAPSLSRLNLNAAGGSALARYVISLSYMNDQGIFVTSNTNTYNTNAGIQRYLLNSKVDVDVNKYFSLRLQVMGRLQDANEPGATTGAILNNLLSTPNNAYPVNNPNGSYGGNPNFTQNLLAQTVASGYALDHVRDVISNVTLNYKLDKVTKGLWVRGGGSVSVESETNMNRSLQTSVYQAVVGGDTTYNHFGSSVAQISHYATGAWARYRYIQLTAGYDRRFGDHSVNGELLFDQKRSLLNYDLPAQLTNFAGKAAYSYKDRYFAQGAANYSGYDRYEPGHQYGLFYAGGLGWDVSKEDFFHKLAPWIDHFKIRATYGLTGNANVDYYGYYIWREHFGQSAPNYAMGSTYNFAVQTLAEGGPVGSQFLPNSNATWEKADKFDGGVDLVFLHNTLSFTADYYHERYFDVMQQRGDNIQLIGIGYPAENIGRNLYQGAEIELTYQNRVGNFNYFFTGNASVQQTKVLYMDEQYEQNSWNVHTGRPVGQLFGYIANGLYQTAAQAAASPTFAGYTPQAGDIRYKDLNGDGVIDQFDLAPLGKGRPLIYYGLTAGFNFKGIEFSALIQGVGNREEYANSQYMQYVNEGFLTQGNVFTQAYQQVLGRWIPENAAVATSPRLTAGGNANNFSPGFASSSYLLQNGNYWRLKNISLGYNLPYQWLKRAKIGSVKIFVDAQNLFTHEAYKGMDPEVSLPNYPIQKVVNFGIKLKL